MPSDPNQPVRDYVLPIGVVKQNDAGDGIELVKFLGTGFLIGSEGFLITAAHVVELDLIEGEILAAMMVHEDGSWTGHNFSHAEKHPNQDIAILKMHNCFQSPLIIQDADIRSASEYHMFGYPVDAMYELTHPQTGRAHGRPDLVYYKGYVRRRMSFPIFSMTGDAFYELSEPAHKGCSGSPVFQIKHTVWNVIGVYLGVRINNENLILSYALRFDAIKDWIPETLGRPFSQILV